MKQRNVLTVIAASMLFPLLSLAAKGNAAEIRLTADQGMCIHKERGDTGNGNPVHLWQCNVRPAGVNNKRWVYEDSTGLIRLSSNPNKCLHKKRGDWNNGNPVHLWDCSAGSNAMKTWFYDRSTGYIHARVNASMCFHKQRGDNGIGNPIHLWRCDSGNANQRWVIR